MPAKSKKKKRFKLPPKERQISIFMDDALASDFNAHLESTSPRASRTAAVKLAIKEYLQHRNRKRGGEKRQNFIRALAEFFVDESATKSIELELGKRCAQDWANLRNMTPLFGYPTIAEAEQVLTEFLG